MGVTGKVTVESVISISQKWLFDEMKKKIPAVPASSLTQSSFDFTAIYDFAINNVADNGSQTWGFNVESKLIYSRQ